VALVYGYLTEMLGADCDYYIPDRYSEGYGVSQAGVQFAADNGYSLLISLDCGIKAHEKVAWCHEQGIDFIVCDHHLPDETLPNALAVLDPKRTDCGYPFKELTVCGVGFKLLSAFAQANDLEMEPLWDRLDLLACSIAADMVPILDENRIFAYWGLQKLGIDVVALAEKMLGMGDATGRVQQEIADKTDEIKRRNEEAAAAAARGNDARDKLNTALDTTIAKLKAEAQFEREKLKLGESQAQINKTIADEEAKYAAIKSSMPPKPKKQLQDALEAVAIA
jgi:single-stranded DNA-specific DHH superfamily exonuclease